MSREPVDLPPIDTALLHLIFSGALDTLTAGQVRVINDRLRRLDAVEVAARAVTARGGHADGCLIAGFGGCTCGWENALADLAALLEDA